MIMERKVTLTKYAKQFDQIKLVCCKYFEKYDIELETVKIKAKNVMEKYQDWSRVLIEPASMNDARLYSLESRIHEEEEMRLKEFDFLKDLTKKLIYSLEQQSVNQVDGLAKMSANLDVSVHALNQPSLSKTPSQMGVTGMGKEGASQTPILPNLLNNQSLQTSVRDNMNILGKA